MNLPFLKNVSWGLLKIVLWILGVLIILIGMTLVRKFSKEYIKPAVSSGPITVRSEEGMTLFVDSLKAKMNLPIKISQDGSTDGSLPSFAELYDLDYEHKRSGTYVIVYYYRIYETKSKIQDEGRDQLTDEMIEEATSYYCNKMRPLAELGLGWEGEYYDRNYIFLYEVTIYPEDCPQK